MKIKIISCLLIICLSFGLFAGCSEKEEEAIVLRVSNWEEYIDEGDWDEDEVIDLESGTEIFGEKPIVEDFEDWYYETYGKRVVVEYSTFGTNEDLYNQLSIGDKFDLVCPSEYMIMKMYREGMLTPYSKEYFDKDNELNYYIRNVSPYIHERFENLDMGGAALSDYICGFMWGTLGFVYNPEVVTKEAVSHWTLFTDRDYNRRVTIKDSIRDAYFLGLGILFYENEYYEGFFDQPDYKEKLDEFFNLTDPESVEKVGEILRQVKKNTYSFEVDSAKGDIVTGKVVATEQWSGDGVFSMDSAEEEESYLNYSVPEEGTNLWLDGWVMLKDGLAEDPRKQHAAEAFTNFISRPDNAIRNMYYIGYTSCVSGGGEEENLVYEYANWNYGYEEDGAEEYPLGYFFANDEKNENYTLLVDPEQTERQLFAQYPPKEVMDRSVIMRCFTDEENVRINRMWIEVRCF